MRSSCDENELREIVKETRTEIDTNEVEEK